MTVLLEVMMLEAKVREVRHRRRRSLLWLETLLQQAKTSSLEPPATEIHVQRMQMRVVLRRGAERVPPGRASHAH